MTPTISSNDLRQVARVLAAAEPRKDGWVPAEQVTQGTMVDPVTCDRWQSYLRHLLATHRDLSIVSGGDARYPSNLKSVPGRPAVLFIDGDFLHTDDRAIAIVGSRAASPVTLDETYRLASTLAGGQITVVSGLARGTDTAAHEGALAAGGRTLAVMGTGIETVFPPENAALADRIRRHGALVSQFPPGGGPSKTSFPARNAVIAGLGLASLVMTAQERSGTRIEIDHALANGRPVLLWRPQLGSASWAHRLAENPLARFVDSAEDVSAAIGANLAA
ncbi:MAG: DNA-processing protein DprA [Acidimicrobiales bacterium]